MSSLNPANRTQPSNSTKSGQNHSPYAMACSVRPDAADPWQEVNVVTAVPLLVSGTSWHSGKSLSR